MSKLKIIEALYYDPDNITGGFNVTKELIQMVDVDNNNLYYNGSYNDIFGDPFKHVKKKLKIILEFDGYKHTKVYAEDQAINLPQDLPSDKIKIFTGEKDKIAKWSDILQFNPNYHGFGLNLKILWKHLTNKPLLLIKILITLIAILLLIISSYWWITPAQKILIETQKRFFTNYNDPSKVLDVSVFNILDSLNKFSSNTEKQLFIKDYSGLKTHRERGYISNIDTSNNSEVLVTINNNNDSNSLICNFDKKWKQKLLILGRKDIQFMGVIDHYDINENKVLLLFCSLLY